MTILSWIILGAIAGAIAKAILPGRLTGGLLAQILLGVAGGLVGGWLGSALLHIGLGSFWNVKTWLLAIGGSVVVLAVWGALTNGRSKAR
ncbi:MAG: GlsB/YeaQ/YmgE family stress response membrane protein [Propionibacteriaceae bacterium]|jgi:uncharacterized membrane protein YeaQ/YmgE (transglycosylase-associated protein family)|nr:GlsB/YeaQ/YmgE family stress response membrane protein [Propionibacteriaceae bacterium]